MPGLERDRTIIVRACMSGRQAERQAPSQLVDLELGNGRLIIEMYDLFYSIHPIHASNLSPG